MLKKLWSPTGLLRQDINFHPGLNLIVGKYAHDKASLKSYGINGIGKSTTIRLIDYLLASDTADKYFHSSRYNFLREEDHQICLDLVINENLIHLKRYFNEREHIYLRKNNEKEICYTLSEVKIILGSLFFPSSSDRQLSGNRYRSLMSFYIKDDIHYQKRIDPVAFLTHRGVNTRELSILNLFLLGLPNKNLIDFDKNCDILKSLKEKSRVLTKRTEEFTGKKITQLRTDLTIQKKDLDLLQKSLDDFKLIDDFKNVSSLIAELDNQIILLRKQEQKTSRQLSSIKRFTRINHEIDLTDVSEQYLLISNALGNLIHRQLDEIIQFRKSLSEERLRFHGKRMQELEEEQTNIINDLVNLDNKRSALLKSLEGDTSLSLKDAIQRLTEQNSNVAYIERALFDVDAIDKQYNDVELEVNTMRYHAVNSINASADIIKSIQELFITIVDKIIGNHLETSHEGAYLNIEAKTTGRRDQTPISIEIEIPRSDALGHTRLKLVIYDLTVFFHGIDFNLPLPDFLIHDGVYHGVSRRTVVQTLNYIYQRSLITPAFQYIATFNEDELALTSEEQIRDGVFDFDISKKTILTLDDSQDKVLFKRFFT